jgi:2-polyprenyl-6-methoxyphenol hydroxylase-like FAD-dependent oxidoreductase
MAWWPHRRTGDFAGAIPRTSAHAGRHDEFDATQSWSAWSARPNALRRPTRRSPKSSTSEKSRADLVVGAHGIRSTVRRSILGDAPQPRDAGYTAWRLIAEPGARIRSGGVGIARERIMRRLVQRDAAPVVVSGDPAVRER